MKSLSVIRLIHKTQKKHIFRS